jgi:hypothetical protein
MTRKKEEHGGSESTNNIFSILRLCSPLWRRRVRQTLKNKREVKAKGAPLPRSSTVVNPIAPPFLRPCPLVCGVVVDGGHNHTLDVLKDQILG